MSHQSGLLGTWDPTDSTTLEEAYALCERVTRHHSKSFYFATAFLPPAKRQAIRVLYAFCRWSDDIVDEPERRLGYSLDGWVAEAHNEGQEASHPILKAWQDVRHRYQLPRAVIDELLAGVRMDLTVQRYDTFEDLWLYCYRVAATVGLLSMAIVGHEEGAAPYAIKLGIALQLTNILRDVGEDGRRARLYLPLDEIEHFGLREEEILAGQIDERYRALMRFQVARAERLYDEAWPGIAMLHPDSRFAVGAAATVYRAILPAIVANGYDNHRHRAHVPLWRKLSLLPAIWWRLP